MRIRTYLKKNKKTVIIISILIGTILLNLDPITNNFILARIKIDVRDNPMIIKIANEINETCNDYEWSGYETSEWIDICKINEVEYFYYHNMTYRNDTFIEGTFFLNNDVSHTLKYGNDCEGQSIVVLDILKNIGINNTYFLYEKCIEGYHVCSFIQEYNRMIGCYSDCEIMGIKRVI